MALYTRKGDTGTTKTFGCDQRISKSSAVAEALGSLDETNSFLGLCRSGAKAKKLSFHKRPVADVVFDVQQALFIVQAELAGAQKTMPEQRVKDVEEIVDGIEKLLPPIKSFFIPGAAELSARFDAARTIARRAERRVVAVVEEGRVKMGPHSLAYLNRLSSLLYALARFANHKERVKETPPTYQ